MLKPSKYLFTAAMFLTTMAGAVSLGTVDAHAEQHCYKICTYQVNQDCYVWKEVCEEVPAASAVHNLTLTTGGSSGDPSPSGRGLKGSPFGKFSH